MSHVQSKVFFFLSHDMTDDLLCVCLSIGADRHPQLFLGTASGTAGNVNSVICRQNKIEEENLTRWKTMKSKKKKLKEFSLMEVGRKKIIFFPGMGQTKDWICKLAEISRRSEIVDCVWGPRDTKKPDFVQGGARKM